MKQQENTESCKFSLINNERETYIYKVILLTVLSAWESRSLRIRNSRLFPAVW